MEEFFIQITDASAIAFEATFALGMVTLCFFIVALMFGRG
jgi:hypothetical protein